MMFRRAFSSLFLLAALANIAAAQTDAWLEVRTPSFEVVTNSTEKDARRVARQFEQMRAVFHRIFPEADLETATPILVLAVTDKKNLQALEPTVYLAPGRTSLAGLFQPSADQNYVLIWLNGAGVHTFGPIYHEYTHFVTARTGQWMPLWLTEGLAQFYENTLILEDEVRLGRGSPELFSVLQHNPLLPLPTLLAVDQHSPYYHEEDKASVFYAESWALAHYLKTRDDKENTHRVNDYLDLLQRNVDPVEAATQAFGDLTQLLTELRKDVASDDHAYVSLSGSTDVDDSSFTLRTLSQNEADTIRAGFLAHDQRETDARTLLEGVLREDPANASAHEIMGLVALQQHKFDEARRSCEQAIKLDAQRFFAHYCVASATIQTGAPDAAEMANAEENLRTAIKINPTFALDYDALGMLLLMRRKNLDEAYQSMQRAVQLDPGTVELRVDQAQVLARMNKVKEALEALDLALKMSHTPEQIAAVENVLQSVRRFEAEQAKATQQNLVALQGSPTVGKATTQAGAAAVTDARAIYAPQPEYTEEARQARREGPCVVSLIVGPDGKPSNIVVTKKLGMGLDEKAIEAVSKWKFEPARRYGRPVSTHLTLTLQFKMFGENTAKFFELSEKAKSGDPAAEFALANAFFEGRDIPKDESQGLALLQRAAQDGLPQAQFQMAERAYGDGNNPASYVDSYVWYSLAQRGGFERSDQKVTELESRMTPDQLSEAHQRLASGNLPAAK
jgi:TonB family protein